MDAKNLPDIINKSESSFSYSLDKVGMEGIDIPIRIKGSEHFLKARVDIYVNLTNEKSKGIHMSRLYLLLIDSFKKKEFTHEAFLTLHKDLCRSQVNNSDKSYLNVKLDYPLMKKALLSPFEAYRFYPIKIISSYEQGGELNLEYEIDILYSSTCPCSASLSNQVIREGFLTKLAALRDPSYEKIKEMVKQNDFLVATPHAQRSLARVKFQLHENQLNFENLAQTIVEIEEVLKTPVQTVVKREDEQEFARLNSQNLMFCEDASRAIKNYFVKNAHRFSSYSLKVSHYESLHSHDAVAISS